MYPAPARFITLRCRAARSEPRHVNFLRTSALSSTELRVPARCPCSSAAERMMSLLTAHLMNSQAAFLFFEALLMKYPCTASCGKWPFGPLGVFVNAMRSPRDVFVGSMMCWVFPIPSR